VTKRITVIVEGCKYVVEVGDLRERPIKATVNQNTYQVQLPDYGSQSAVAMDTTAKESISAGIQDVDCASIAAPMPGDILEVDVKPGQTVEVGDLICVLEAMKMKNLIRSSRAGVIATVDVSPGQSVEYGAVLVTFK
jgi:glutaconyl-CoA/methylmalonyl-CoA decarboxylase subunit gamma